MTKKKWALLLLCILLLAGYYKLFYKTYSESVVAKNADCIIALDVKRIINTIVWNVITTPSQWNQPSIFSSEKDKISWDDMVKVPDYIFIFHSANHPANAWYTVLEIKDKDDFNKGLQQYHFEKEGDLYFSKQLGVVLLQNGNSLLAGNLAVKDIKYIRETANELFVKKQYSTKAFLEKNVDATSHLTVQVLKNDFLKKEALIRVNFDKTSITINALFYPSSQFSIIENNFSYSTNSLFAMGFTQPSATVYGLLTDSNRTTISRALNFNIDSLLLQNNHHYSLDIAAIQPRVDSAISYTYDDNFNPVKKVVVNNVLEPLFNFTVNGNGSASVYDYWENNGKLERTGNGDLFIPMPFVKSYCSKASKQQLNIISTNYIPAPADKNINCVFFLNVLITKIPAPLMKYLPDDLVKAISNIETIQVTAQKNQQQIDVHCSLNKKKNDLPLIDW
jgi:hypothetical protein